MYIILFLAIFPVALLLIVFCRYIDAKENLAEIKRDFEAVKLYHEYKLFSLAQDSYKELREDERQKSLAASIFNLTNFTWSTKRKRVVL